MEDKVWTRREGESPQAYEAFRVFLHQGPKRSTLKTAKELNKVDSLIRRWSSKYDWQSRSVAYDNYLLSAKDDGMVSQLAQSRDKNLALMDKLRAHLSDRLDHFIETRQDPTIRWTQALTAMAKVEQNSLLLKDNDKTDERIGRIEDLVERALEERA